MKENAAELLRKELSSPRYVPEPIGMSGITDCYQPVERKLEITRACLKVMAEFRNPVGIVTKNHLVTRDIDILSDLASDNAAMVNLSVTSLDEKVQRVMEPRTSSPKKRLEAIEKAAKAGIPVNVLVAPVIPGLTDHEIPRIVEAAANAGARGAGMIPVRLPYQNKEMFERWLEMHFPDRTDKVLNRIRSMRGGKLNDSRFGSRMRGEGIFADQMRALLHAARRKAGMDGSRTVLSTAAFRRPRDQRGQMGLFG